MSSLVSLVDEKGCLLPPEQCNIKPLVCLTKDRAPSPVRRSPTRIKQNNQTERKISTELPTFIHELNTTGKLLIISPAALKDSGLSKQKYTTNTASREYSTPTGLVSYPDGRIPSFEVGVKKKRRRMKSNEEGNSEEIELSENPVPLWSTEDVCVWLEFVDLQNLKEKFISQKVTGETLGNLNYETLERLGLSNSSEERELFLGAVYELQEEYQQSDQEGDKEIEETLKDSPEHGENANQNNKDATSSHTGSDIPSSGSLTSSSRTESEHRHSPTSEDQHIKTQEEKVATSQQHTSTNSSDKASKGTVKTETAPKTVKDLSKPGEKKRKSRTKRISRFWNSFHGNKSSSILKNIPPGPFYKNVFHNLMNTGPQGVIKIWTEMFLTDMQYVSLLVSHETTAAETIKMVLEKSNAQEDPECYRICEINEKQIEHILDKNECPLQRERQWTDPDNCRFELRWRNERLVEWDNGSGDVAKDLPLQNPDQSSAPSKDEEERSETVSSPTSPESDESKNYTDTKFDYNVEVEYKEEREPNDTLVLDRALKESTTTDESVSNSTDGITVNGISKNVDTGKDRDEPGSLLRAHKQHLTSSCPDLTSQELFEDRRSLGKSSDKSGTDEDDIQTTFDDERAYSQLLRTSSKNLSGRLKLKTRNEQMEIKRDNGEHEGGTTKDASDVEGKDTMDGNALVTATTITVDESVPDRINGDNSGTEGDITKGDVISGEQITVHEDLVAGTENKSSDENQVEELEKLQGRVKEVEKENLLLIEDNRELKKSCRTFEGRSRLKERELEELEEEKNELSSQMKEMVDDLHSLRTDNTELRTNLAEANTKLGDVDGWVTREVFEDIRGQLSLSEEEVEKKEEEILEMKKEVAKLKTENNKIEVLEAEVEKLNERIKEDQECIEGIQKDAKDKQKKIQESEGEIEKLRASVKKREKQKEDLVTNLKETENEMNEGIKKHTDAKKDLQKRLSDREYEILIMKEEKKELCVKLKSLEGNIEGLQVEMKKKDADHEGVIAEMNEQSDIKDESLSVTVSNLEQLVTERDQRINQLKKQLLEKSQGELQAKEHEYEQNKLYLKHLIALVRKKDPKLLDQLNKTLKSRDKDDWC